jgi:hypothetical protein
MQVEKTGPSVSKGFEPSARGFAGLIDAVLFLAILGAFAVAIVAIAFAAPLAIAVSAALGALSAVTARHGRRRGWRTAGAA